MNKPLRVRLRCELFARYQCDLGTGAPASRPSRVELVRQHAQRSVLTLGEIRKGVERLPDAPRREKPRLWLEHDLRDWFGARILPVDAAVADRWGRLLAEAGRPVPSIDSLLAATALHHELRLVSRNSKDFVYPGLEVINPWAAEAK